MELTLFRRLLALGAVLLRLFFITQAAGCPPEPVTALDGTRRTYHNQRPTSYYLVFGKVRVWRQYFTAPGHGGICPLDAELSLPAGCYSDLLRKWAAYRTTDESYRGSQTVLARIQGLSLSVQALETGSAEAGEDVAALYEQRADPPPAPTVDTILVVQADRKGVPVVQPPPPGHPPLGWAKGRSEPRRRRPS